jgi:hypothetical protein
MNTQRLIDALVQQTTVLIAQLATTAGVRAPLAHVANQVFYDLAQAIEAQGVGRKVAADMFGLALRSYQLKIQRLAESATERENSLWQAVYDFVLSRPVITRAEVLLKFCYDDQASIKAILHDLVETGLVFQTGHGDGLAYRAATEAEVKTIARADTMGSTPWVVWIAIYRSGLISAQALADKHGMSLSAVEDAIERLVNEGHVHVEIAEDGTELFKSEICVIPMEEPAGWEAAVFDHFNAVVAAFCIKLRELRLRTMPGDVVGGSTYSFNLYPGHPYEDEVTGLLRETRKRLTELRQKVTEHNEAQGWPTGKKVTFYFGQSVVIESIDLNSDDNADLVDTASDTPLSTIDE